MTRIKRYRTGFLYPRPSFLLGLGSVFGIAGNYYRFKYYNTNEEADRKAIENDWGVIGDDIRTAFDGINGKSLQLYR